VKLKIAVVCYSNGLDYDDRIRKECLALAKNHELMIFAVFSDNRAEKGITSYGIPYMSFQLRTRIFFPSSSFLLLKAIDFYIRVSGYLKCYDRIWAHEEYTFLFALLAKRNKLIWDLHEIPEYFEKILTKKIFHVIERNCRTIIHANPFRIEYLKQKKVINYPDKHFFIRNFPDTMFLSSTELPNSILEFKAWLGTKGYVYLQGLDKPSRYPYQSLSSVLETTDLKIVVVGSFEKRDALRKLILEYGSILQDRVYFTGKIPQLSIPAFLKNALFSIVLYDTKEPNNRYCEANRFFQSINFGVPVISGFNESMAEIIEQYQAGIALRSDGRDIEELKNAIKSLCINYPFYKRNCEGISNVFVWRDQMIDNKFIM
jgi:glycosyltransferase involved in cell wall biosynthesis